MKIKKTLFTLACLSISTIVSAAGITPAQIEAARAVGTLNQVWIASSSASAISIYRGWAKDCEAGTGSIFFASQAASDSQIAPGSLGDFVAYACRHSGRTSILYHTMDGDSLSVFSPFTIGTKLARLSYLGNAGCTKLSTGFTNPSFPYQNADVYQGCQRTGANIVLDEDGAQTEANKNSNAAALASNPTGPQQIIGGFSDVEPTMFSQAIGGGNVSSFGTLSNTYIGQVFGVAVSIPFYRKLQEIQGISEVTTEYNPELAPSLTKSQIATILGEATTVQGAESWSPLLDVEASEKVIVNRRVNTAGTQAASNAFFLGNPCLGNSGWFPTVVTQGNYQVNVNQQDRGVKNLITIASNASVGSRYAIGVLSLAGNNWRTDKAGYSGYRYIKVDGMHPEIGDIGNARKATTTGMYPFHMEMKSFLVDGLPMSGFERNVFTKISSNMRNPNSIAACNFDVPRGITINPEGGNIVCVAGEDKIRFSNFGNNCSIPLLYE